MDRAAECRSIQYPAAEAGPLDPRWPLPAHSSEPPGHPPPLKEALRGPSAPRRAPRDLPTPGPLNSCRVPSWDGSASLASSSHSGRCRAQSRRKRRSGISPQRFADQVAGVIWKRTGWGRNAVEKKKKTRWRWMANLVWARVRVGRPGSSELIGTSRILPHRLDFQVGDRGLLMRMVTGGWSPWRPRWALTPGNRGGGGSTQREGGGDLRGLAATPSGLIGGRCFGGRLRGIDQWRRRCGLMHVQGFATLRWTGYLCATSAFASWGWRWRRAAGRPFNWKSWRTRSYGPLVVDDGLPSWWGMRLLPACRRVPEWTGAASDERGWSPRRRTRRAGLTRSPTGGSSIPPLPNLAPLRRGHEAAPGLRILSEPAGRRCSG